MLFSQFLVRLIARSASGHTKSRHFLLKQLKNTGYRHGLVQAFIKNKYRSDVPTSRDCRLPTNKRLESDEHVRCGADDLKRVYVVLRCFYFKTGWHKDEDNEL